LQVGYLRYAPLHHHFHLAGWSEPQVVVRFWLLAAALAALALATIKLQ
jgi:phospho-N-acetylmuramoyl-pentapeptide-transferase